MKEYIMTVVGVSVFCGFVEMLSLNEASFKKHIKLVASLCVLCVAISPIGSLIELMRDFRIEGDSGDFDREAMMDKYDDVYVENLMGYTAQEISEYLESMICKEFDIDGADIDIFVSVAGGEEMSVEHVQVILYPKAISKDPHKISEYIFERLGFECEIIYK